MHASRFSVLGLATLLLLPACAEASFLGTLLFGKDTLEPVRAAIRETEQLRQEVFGWYKHNATQQANFTVTPDPKDLYTILPAIYSGRSLVDPDGSYYSDVEGYYKGEWTGWDFSTRSNRSLALDSRLNHTAVQKLSASQPSQVPEYLEGAKEDKLILDRGSFDWLSVQPGHVDLHLREEHLLPGNVSLITGSLSFAAPANTKSSIESVDFSLEGLHFIPTGSIFLHALSDESQQITDVRKSLGMIPQGNNDTANATVSAIDKAFQLRIDMLNRIIASGSYESEDAGPADPPTVKHNCSLHVYAQFRSAGAYTDLQPQIDALERENKKSTGISTIPPPALRLAVTAYSPECQVVLSSNELEGLLQSRLWKKGVRYAILFFVVLFIQTRLLVQQMEVTTTPSGLAKMSDKTWLAQSVLDAYGCLIHLSVGVAVENETTIPLIACAFMSGMCFLAFGYRYTIVIYRSQMDAAPSPAPAPAPATVPATVQSTAAVADPTSQTSPQNGTNVTSVNANTSSAAAPSSDFITSTISAISAADAAAATPEEIAARRRGANILLVALFLIMVGFFPIFTVKLMLPFLYSFWIPQIWRNVQRGTRKAILKRCVIGTTLTRLYIPLYFLVCPNNVLFDNEYSFWGWMLAAYLGLQAAILVGQDLFGPHWFLPAKYVPEGAKQGWEYHPLIYPGGDEEEGAGVVGGAGREEREYGDCAICLTAIENKKTTRKRSVNNKRQKKKTTSKQSRSWFGRSSDYAYDRIAEHEAEDFELEHDDNEDDHLPNDPPSTTIQIYPPEKSSSSSPSSPAPVQHTHYRAHTSPSTTTVRSRLARIIRTMLRWKQTLTSNLDSSQIAAVGGRKRRRMDVMLAPCQHAFHTECLERWLHIKNECPSCRSGLPPV